MQKEMPSAENGRPEVEGAVNPVAQALKNLVLSPSPQKCRRHASVPTAGVNVKPTPAAHISNPITPYLGGSTSPTHDKPSQYLHPQEPQTLTSDATVASPLKNNLPLTPRTSAHENGRHDQTPPPLSISAGAAAPPPDPGPTPERSPDEHAGTELGVSRSNEPLPTGCPQGELAVKIDEARGLKPSYDPYVVCVFEWNEYISKGPRHDAMDVDLQDDPSGVRNRKDIIASLPIRRADGVDSGKPKAILMKSRQSSNNSDLGSLQSRRDSLVTDPQWDHEATL